MVKLYPPQSSLPKRGNMLSVILEVRGQEWNLRESEVSRFLYNIGIYIFEL